MNARDFMGAGGAMPRSLWAATAITAPETTVAEGDIRADVAIVGGGYVGLRAALALAEAGVDVVVLEAAEIGWGASGRNGGQVIPGLKHDPAELVDLFGRERGERLADFVGSAADAVFDTIDRYGLACDAVRKGWIQPAHDGASLRLIERRCNAWRSRGADVSMLDSGETARLTGSTVYCGGWIDRRAGCIQPLSYARGLAAAAIARSVRIFTRSAVTGAELNRSDPRLTTARARIAASKVLLATGAYSGEIGHDLRRTFVAPNSFQIATEPLPDRLRAVILPEGQVASDARRLLLYYRLDAEGRLLIGGRGTFCDPDKAEGFDHLRKALATVYPQVADQPIAYRWGGRVAITLDHLPHLHRLGPCAAALLGFNGRGVALSSALGIAMADWLRSGDDEAVPLPFSALTNIPFHGLQEAYIGAGSAWYRFRDWTG
jgi:glycine/D-amino acid oxidase-like deaminating enzyme